MQTLPSRRSRTHIPPHTHVECHKVPHGTRSSERGADRKGRDHARHAKVSSVVTKCHKRHADVTKSAVTAASISSDSGIKCAQARHPSQPSAICAIACHAKAVWSATPAKQDKKWEEEGGGESAARGGPREREGGVNTEAAWMSPTPSVLEAGATRQDSMEREGCRQE